MRQAACLCAVRARPSLRFWVWSSMKLTDRETSILAGAAGTEGDRMAMEIVAEAARMLGAERLVPISSSHIDGCLYHGDSGVLFCEKLVDEGARVTVPSTTNVISLNLLKPNQSRLPAEQRRMAYRLMVAHSKLGCIPSWTCAPYQRSDRPTLGQQIAWGESNAVAFANTVLGARTNRYGDYLDIACAISGRAPYYGLHRAENRKAKLLIDLAGLSAALLREDAFFAVLGSLVGRLAGEAVCVIEGVPANVREDQLKAFCAAGGDYRHGRACAHRGRDSRSTEYQDRPERPAAGGGRQGLPEHDRRRAQPAQPRWTGPDRLRLARQSALFAR